MGRGFFVLYYFAWILFRYVARIGAFAFPREFQINFDRGKGIVRVGFCSFSAKMPEWWPVISHGGSPIPVQQYKTVLIGCVIGV